MKFDVLRFLGNYTARDFLLTSVALTLVELRPMTNDRKDAMTASPATDPIYPGCIYLSHADLLVHCR